MLEPERKYCPYPKKTLDFDGKMMKMKINSSWCVMNDELFVHEAGAKFITVYASRQNITRANPALVRSRPDWF
jgi:hypothetical protein